MHRAEHQEDHPALAVLMASAIDLITKLGKTTLRVPVFLIPSDQFIAVFPPPGVDPFQSGFRVGRNNGLLNCAVPGGSKMIPRRPSMTLASLRLNP